MIYQATNHTRNKQLGSALSKDLQKKYGKRSVRISKGDSITIVRGEYSGVDGKVSQISIQKNAVAIEGIKKEQTRGGKFDVYIHTSNLVVKSLNGNDKWRIARLEGKDPRKQPRVPKEKTAETIKDKPKETVKETSKVEEKTVAPKVSEKVKEVSDKVEEVPKVSETVKEESIKTTEEKIKPTDKETKDDEN